jgi:hypothetical protein
MGSAELLPGSQCQAPLAARLLAVHPGAAQHEAANKEAQSTNEEMANRNTELNSISNDLANLQSSTQIAIVLLGRDLAIRCLAERVIANVREEKYEARDKTRHWYSLRIRPYLI